MSRSIPSQRHLFDIPRDTHYLNCAYISPLMVSARAAAVEGLRRESRPWTITPPDFFDPLEDIRRLFARLINAGVDDIAIVPSASYGVATAACNVVVEPGTKIVTLQDQFPSNVYAWRELAKSRQASLEVVGRPPDGDWTTRVLSAIDHSTAVVALPNNHWMDGALLDLVSIGRQARKVGAAFVLDTTQSLGAMPLDIAELKPDFMASAGYKWMLGPYGFSYLYVDRKWHDGQPLEYNGLNMEDGVDFPRLAELKDSYADGARRFDAGERAHFTLAPAAAATLQQILDWGVDNIYYTLSQFNEEVERMAEALGLLTLPAQFRAGHFIGLRFPRRRFPNGPPPSLQQALQDRRVIVSVRGESLRVTPHLYNDDEDLAALRACLETALR